MNYHKGFIAPLLLALIAILLVGGGAYVYMQNRQIKQSDTATQSAHATSTTQTSDWKTYRSDKYGFEFKYPDINARLKTVGGWTDSNEPKITSRTPFNYNECVLAGEGPGMSASKITIAKREYCLITVYAVEPGTFGFQYEYVSLIGNEDIGIVFSFSGNRGVNEQQVDTEAQTLFSQILSTLTLSYSTMPTSNQSEQEKQLSLARLKAKDALIKSDLSQVQQQAKINYAEIGKDYVGFCTDSFVIKTLAHIQSATGITPTACNSSTTAVAASSPLAVDSTKFWCVDSTGFSGQTATPLGTNTVCQK